MTGTTDFKPLDITITIPECFIRDGKATAPYAVNGREYAAALRSVRYARLGGEDSECRKLLGKYDIDSTEHHNLSKRLALIDYEITRRIAEGSR